MPDLHQIFVHVTSGRGSVLLWQRCDILCTTGLWMTSYLHIMARQREKAYTQSVSRDLAPRAYT